MCYIVPTFIIISIYIYIYKFIHSMSHVYVKLINKLEVRISIPSGRWHGQRWCQDLSVKGTTSTM